MPIALQDRNWDFKLQITVDRIKPIPLDFYGDFNILSDTIADIQVMI